MKDENMWLWRMARAMGFELDKANFDVELGEESFGRVSGGVSEEDEDPWARAVDPQEVLPGWE